MSLAALETGSCGWHVYNWVVMTSRNVCNGHSSFHNGRLSKCPDSMHHILSAAAQTPGDTLQCIQKTTMIETKKGANDSWKHRGNIKGGTTVVFKDSGIAGKQKTFAQLEKVMSQLGFIRWTWDYDFVIYDMRFDDLNNNKTYYL